MAYIQNQLFYLTLLLPSTFPVLSRMLFLVWYSVADIAHPVQTFFIKYLVCTPTTFSGLVLVAIYQKTFAALFESGAMPGAFYMACLSRTDVSSRILWFISYNFRLKAGIAHQRSADDQHFTGLLPLGAGCSQVISRLDCKYFGTVCKAYAYLALGTKT